MTRDIEQGDSHRRGWPGTPDSYSSLHLHSRKLDKRTSNECDRLGQGQKDNHGGQKDTKGHRWLSQCLEFL